MTAPKAFSVIVMCALTLSADASAAQGTIAIPETKVGDRVRVESPWVLGAWVSGPLVEANQGYVAVTVGDDHNASIVVPWAKIVSIGLAAGRDRKAMAAKGALVGFGAALLAGPPLWELRGQSGAGATLGIAATLGLPAAGALIGWTMGLPRWRSIDWRPSIDSVLPEGEAIRLRLPADTRVTVRANRRTFQARAVSTGDSLVVRAGADLRTLAWSDVSELRMRGHRDRMRGAAIGLTTMGVYAGLWIQRHSLVGHHRPAEFVIQRIAIGGLVGALIGTPGWTRVPTPKASR